MAEGWFSENFHGSQDRSRTKSVRDRFKTYMDKFLPNWQQSGDILNREPLRSMN